jgi:predicted nucleic acid-binding protein
LSGYADTSFMVSLYTLDANSSSAAKLMTHSRLPLLITPLGELELMNALQLRVFRKELDTSEIKAANAFFRRDLEAGVFTLKPLSPGIFERAKLLARKQTATLGTRTLDLLHVASALVLQADALYTFDRQQEKLARAESLKLP